MTALQIVQKYYPNVKSVTDAGKPITVEVSKKDCTNSAIRNHNACAFAEACKRSENIDGAVIAVTVAYLVKNGVAKRYSIPESLSREIVVFDRNGQFSPGVYKLLAPKRKLGDPSARGSETRSKKGRKVRYRHSTQAIRSLH